MKFNEKNLAFTDCESSGLSEFDHEILELAVLLYDQKNKKITKEWEVKIKPSHIESATQEALKINGYLNNPNLYSTSLNSALIKFNSLVRDCILVGQNISFDLRFINKNMKDLNIKPSFDCRSLELMSLSWWKVKDTEIEGLSLKKICSHFNVSNVGEHSALVDCRRAFEVYKRLEKLYE